MYIIYSCGVTKSEFGELKVISNMRKFNKFGMNKFNTYGITRYFISLWCHFDITGRSSVNVPSVRNKIFSSADQHVCYENGFDKFNFTVQFMLMIVNNWYVRNIIFAGSIVNIHTEKKNYTLKGNCE